MHFQKAGRARTGGHAATNRTPETYELDRTDYEQFSLNLNSLRFG
jgi:hypothetical protein